MTGDAGRHAFAGGSREVVLGRIRAALEHSPADPPPVRRSYRTAGEHPPGSAPVVRLFAERLRDYKAAVRSVRPDRVRDAMAQALPGDGRTLVPPGLPPEWMPPGAVVDAGFDAAALDRFDAVVTGCAAAAAETGTIALDGSPGQGRRALSLVPDRHVCVVRAEQVVQTVPELLARLDPTRPLTLVSGPSATSDIELQRVEGVHGPRTLVVILVS